MDISQEDVNAIKRCINIAQRYGYRNIATCLSEALPLMEAELVLRDARPCVVRVYVKDGQPVLN